MPGSGVIEDILKAQRVKGISIFIVVGRGYQAGILGRGVGHKTEVALIGYAAIGRHYAATLGPAACCNARGMGAVGLYKAVAGMAQSQQRVAARVIAAHG